MGAQQPRLAGAGARAGAGQQVGVGRPGAVCPGNVDRADVIGHGGDCRARGPPHAAFRPSSVYDWRYILHRYPAYMPQTASPASAAAPFRQDGNACHVAGDWSVLALAEAGEVERLRSALARAVQDGVRWDLHGISRLDTIVALLIWQAWGEKLPERVRWSAGQQDVFNALAMNKGGARAPEPKAESWGWVRALGGAIFRGAENGRALLVMLGKLVLDFGAMLRRPRLGPWREISAQVYRTGAQALGITALVGFLIGVVLSYLSAQQLQMIGADRFIPSWWQGGRVRPSRPRSA
ncbi:hypothetical protein G6F57_016609 [Rhizopus arrhizus]|nr:hypothetical protein G6F57_016609 [Rhizopus arrhizus]